MTRSRAVSCCSTRTPSSPPGGSRRCAAAQEATRVSEHNAVLEQRRNLLVPRFCADNPGASATIRNRPRRACPRCSTHLSGSADRRRILHVCPPRIDRRDRRVRHGVRPGLWRGERLLPRAARAADGGMFSPTMHSSCMWAAVPSRAEGAFVPTHLALLLERHPHYMRMVEEYIAADPLRALREAALSEGARAVSPVRGVFYRDTRSRRRTETHVRALIDASRDRWRHHLAIAVGDIWQVEEHRAEGCVVAFTFDRRAPSRRDSSAPCARRARNLPRPPSQRVRLPRGPAGGDGRPRCAVRVYRSRSQFRLSHDYVPCRGRALLWRCDRQRGVQPMPRRSARIRRLRHRGQCRRRIHGRAHKLRVRDHRCCGIWRQRACSSAFPGSRVT